MKSLRIALWIGVIIAGLFLITLGLYLDLKGEDEGQSFIAGFNKGVHFTLTDENGTTYNSQSLEDDQYALIFFGFTYCPAICPAELQKMATVMDLLDEQQAERVQPLFVTVDPERDTPEVLKDYVTLFHPEIKGLTGTQEEISAILDDWHIYAAKAQDPSMTEYTMDHSTYTYMIDNDMNILGVFRIDDKPDDIAYRIKKIITGTMSNE